MTEIANGIKTRRTAASRSILRRAWSTLSLLDGSRSGRPTRNASRRSRAPRFPDPEPEGNGARRGRWLMRGGIFAVRAEAETARGGTGGASGRSPSGLIKRVSHAVIVCHSHAAARRDATRVKLLTTRRRNAGTPAPFLMLLIFFSPAGGCGIGVRCL